MSKALDAAFEALAQQVSRDAADIECDPEEYQDGLKTIIETLKTDLRASQETSGDDRDDDEEDDDDFDEDDLDDEDDEPDKDTEN
jgi:hypothetical protein